MDKRATLSLATPALRRAFAYWGELELLKFDPCNQSLLELTTVS